MKLSNIEKETLMGWSREKKWNFVCGAVRDDGETGDVALLLGTKPAWVKERILAAARLYHAGRVRYIVPSGGVEWDTDGEMLSEALYMKRILLAEGVPEEAIILENEATTTKENMIYGALQINRKTKFYDTKRIVIVTSVNHMQRSLALAHAFLPAFCQISAYPATETGTCEEYLRGKDNAMLLDNALELTKGLVDHGIIEDIEIDLENL
jgi:vancomycin permeability regulator SanA